MSRDSIELKAAQSQEAARSMQEAFLALQAAEACPGLEEALDSAKLPEDFVLAMKAFWDAYDRYISVVASGSSFSCKKGCSACCSDNPRGNTGVELLWLYTAIRSQPTYMRQAGQLVSRGNAFTTSVSPSRGKIGQTHKDISSR